LVHAARLQYGLRTSDYARYHRHATRRISTLHKGLKKKNNVKKIAFTAESVQKDERLLELLVWEAERAWAEGLRTREELAALERDPKNKAALARKRHRSAKRLARASQHAQKLAELLQASQTSFPISNTLQSHIYSLYMQGYHDFVLASATASSSKLTAQKGAEHLSTGYVLLESFAKDTQRSTDEALAYELLDELEPMIRFCAYTAEIPSKGSVPELARATGMPIVSKDKAYAELVDEYREEQEKVAKRGGKRGDQQGETVKAIKWRDIDIPIRSAELSSALGKVQIALQNLQGNSSKANKRSRKPSTDTSTSSGHAAQIAGGENAMNDYDRTLATLSESAERSKKLVDDNAVALSKAHSARFESATRPLSLANSYITFQLLSIRLRRDEALFASVLAKLSAREAGKSTSHKRVSPQAAPITIVTARRRAKTFPVLIKLLESILQSLEQLRELDIVEDDSEDLAGIVDCKLAFDKSQRCASGNLQEGCKC
jgi:signal recognition particle subunit SRP68